MWLPLDSIAAENQCLELTLINITCLTCEHVACSFLSLLKMIDSALIFGCFDQFDLIVKGKADPKNVVITYSQQHNSNPYHCFFCETRRF